MALIDAAVDVIDNDDVDADVGRVDDALGVKLVDVVGCWVLLRQGSSEVIIFFFNLS